LGSCTQVSARHNPWPSAQLPRGPAAILSALHFSDPREFALAGLSDAEWRAALEFSDRSQLTLPLRARAFDHLPQWLRDRTAENAARNRLRLARTEDLYRTLDARLRSHRVEYLALKGLTQCPHYGTPPELRVQYDIDLYVPREIVRRAGAAVVELGFESLAEIDHLPTDHLPPFIRKTGWEWRGDFFDPELPLAVELHYQFWNERTERLHVPDVAAFWERRTTRPVAGILMPVLGAADALGYTALHLLRHLLRGSARPFHIYEIAGFLERHADDGPFWRDWRGLHSPEFRKLEAVVFRLALEWFGCRLAPEPADEIANLPAATKAWFEHFATSPATAIFHPQKDELWLHLSLLESRRDRWSIARLRLFPINRPGPVDAIHVPASEMTLRRRALKWTRYAAHVSSRLWRHAAALPHAARSAWKLWRA
jgi:hypothetical protein